MALSPRMSIDDGYAEGKPCAICGAIALRVVHMKKYPDYVQCDQCGSAFVLEDGGSWVMYGHIGMDLPETKTLALRQWTWVDAIRERAAEERQELASRAAAPPPAGAPAQEAEAPAVEEPPIPTPAQEAPEPGEPGAPVELEPPSTRQGEAPAAEQEPLAETQAPRADESAERAPVAEPPPAEPKEELFPPPAETPAAPEAPPAEELFGPPPTQEPAPAEPKEELFPPPAETPAAPEAPPAEELFGPPPTQEPTPAEPKEELFPPPAETPAAPEAPPAEELFGPPPTQEPAPAEPKEELFPPPAEVPADAEPTRREEEPFPSPEEAEAPAQTVAGAPEPEVAAAAEPAEAAWLPEDVSDQALPVVPPFEGEFESFLEETEPDEVLEGELPQYREKARPSSLEAQLAAEQVEAAPPAPAQAVEPEKKTAPQPREPQAGIRYQVTVKGNKIKFPGNVCVHCLRTPVRLDVAVRGSLPNPEHPGERKVVDFRLPLCAACRKRAHAKSKRETNALLLAHGISLLTAILLVLVAILVPLVDLAHQPLIGMIILGLMAILGYSVPALILFSRANRIPPPRDAAFVLTTLRVEEGANDLETVFKWRNRGYAELFRQVNRHNVVGGVVQVSDDEPFLRPPETEGLPPSPQAGQGEG